MDCVIETIYDKSKNPSFFGILQHRPRIRVIYKKCKENQATKSKVFTKKTRLYDDAAAEFGLLRQLFRNTYKKNVVFFAGEKHMFADFLLYWIQNNYEPLLGDCDHYIFNLNRVHESIPTAFYKDVFLLCHQKEDLYWRQMFTAVEKTELYERFKKVITHLMALFATLNQWTSDTLIDIPSKSCEQNINDFIYFFTFGHKEKAKYKITMKNGDAFKHITTLLESMCLDEFTNVSGDIKSLTINAVLLVPTLDILDSCILVFIYLVFTLNYGDIDFLC